MTEHRYPRNVLMSDYARAGAGALLSLGPLLIVPASTTVTVVLAGIGLLFIVFAGRTWLRQGMCVRTDEEGVAMVAQGEKRIAWRNIGALELRYYATRRERARGWMQMTLRGDKTTFRFESTLDGFEDIAKRAARAALDNGVALSPSTTENLRALGVALDGIPENSQGKAYNAR